MENNRNADEIPRPTMFGTAILTLCAAAFTFGSICLVLMFKRTTIEVDALGMFFYAMVFQACAIAAFLCTWHSQIKDHERRVTEKATRDQLTSSDSEA